MASDDKKAKASPGLTTEPAAKKEAPAKKKDEGKAKDKSTAAEPAKAEGSETAAEKTADAPASYSRGEGQKPVTNAYRDNWNAIYGKKKKR